MKPDALAAMLTDAIVDEMKRTLPELVSLRAQEVVEPQLEALARELTHVKEQLATLRAEFAALSAQTREETIAAEEHARRALTQALEALPPPERGPQGPPGPQGPAGVDGKDATFIAPVPWSARTHARGTIVQHRNALWFANVATDREPGTAMSGFALILDGALPAGIELDETGAPLLRFDFASGVTQRWPLPRFLNHCGIWDATRTYHAQDCVTCEGSVWVARREVRERRPGTDAGAAAWTLIVKRGKDGRDGRDGRDGKDGRDAPRRVSPKGAGAVTA